jgi:hypothetical protein
MNSLTLGTMLVLLLSEDTAPLLTLEYCTVVIMWQTVGILDLEVRFAILPVKIPSVIASPAVGRAVAVLGGSEVAVMVDDDQVRHVDAATVRVGTKSTDNVQDNPCCHTDNARDVPGSVGVADVDKEDALVVACVEKLVTATDGSARLLVTQHASNEFNSSPCDTPDFTPQFEFKPTPVCRLYLH